MIFDSMPPKRGVILAAPATGSGKTLLTLGIIRAFAAAGRGIAAFKTGPDYIDPAFHSAALGRDDACLNLDGWAMGDATLSGLLASRDGDLVIGEGVMGLFDGARGVSGHDEQGRGDGSTADLAARLGLPVILIVDAKGQGASLAALVAGFAKHRADIHVAAIILNRVSGEAHAALLKDALAPLGLPVLGAVPNAPDLILPSRHLGLVQARETADLSGLIDRAADLVRRHIDLDALTSLAQPLALAAPDPMPLIAPLGSRIAVARDDAFAFAYPAMLDGWRRAGAELTFFSPLADQPPDAAANAVYLPGGYPELHAGRLAANRHFLAGLKDTALSGSVVYGECGGYMVMGEELVDADGRTHRMAGLLHLATSFAARKLHLGYRQIQTLGEPSALGAPDAAYRGHEFHYATVLREEGHPLFALRDAAGKDLGSAGLRAGRVMGSFIHLIAQMR